MSGNSRKLNDWLSTYIDYTSNQESPEVFHLWSGISIIAATLGRRCWVDRGYYLTYPNEYIILISPSALCKKSTSVEIALDIYNTVYIDRPTFSKRTTLQKLMVRMAECYKLMQTSTVYMFADELSVLLGRSGTNEIIDFMTELYNCKDRWQNETKNAGDDELYKVCVNFIGCTTPRDLATLQSTIIDGGFAGRCIFVYSDKPRPPIHNPKLLMPKDSDTTKKDLINDLVHMSLLSGEFTMTVEADMVHKRLYDANYTKRHADFRMHPYQGRKGEHLIKIAMIVSASYSDSKQITHHDMEAAGQILSNIEGKMPDSFLHIVHGISSKHNDMILKILKDNGGLIQHSELLKKMYRYMDKGELAMAIGTLEDSKLIVTVIEGRHREYQLLIPEVD